MNRKALSVVLLTLGLLLLLTQGSVGASGETAPATSAGHGYVSVAPAAFEPLEEYYDYYNSGSYVRNEDGYSIWYHAPVQLPHGVTINRVRFYWSDGNADYNGRLRLVGVNQTNGSTTYIAILETSGSGSFRNWSETTQLTGPHVDNEYEIYFLELLLPDTNIDCYGAMIEYDYTSTYMPRVVRNNGH